MKCRWCLKAIEWRNGDWEQARGHARFLCTENPIQPGHDPLESAAKSSSNRPVEIGGVSINLILKGLPSESGAEGGT